MSPARHRIMLTVVSLVGAAALGLMAWHLSKTTDTADRARTDNMPNPPEFVHAAPRQKIPPPVPELDPATGVPNLLYVKDGIPRAMALLLEAVKATTTSV